MSINLKNCYASIRYLPSVSKYVVRGYSLSLEKIEDMKVSEVDLLRLINNATIQDTDLDNDTFSDLKFIIRNYFLTEPVILNAKKQYHKRQLKRSLTSVLYLNPRAHQKQRIYEKTQNIENYDAIYKNCLIHDRFEEFMMLNKEWCRYNHIPFKKQEWINKYRNERIKK